MISISFNKSSSKNLKDVLDACAYFDRFSFKNGRYTLNAEVIELFQKWDFFNMIFWHTIDWKFTILTLDDIELFSHTDKTNIFYALQQAHNEWINLYVDFTSELHHVASGARKAEDVKKDTMTEESIDRAIDRFIVNTQKLKYYERFADVKTKDFSIDEFLNKDGIF